MHAINELRIGIDIGGTFTDFVVYDPSTSALTTFKLLSSLDNPAETVLKGLSLIKEHTVATIIHGSTVATNALLERKGAPTAFITTLGFRDLLQIGRQNRNLLYSLEPQITQPLVLDKFRFEVHERVDYRGQTLEKLNPIECVHLTEQIISLNIKSVAICLLFSFLNPAHEQLIAKHLRSAGIQASVSSDILPEYREYERASTTTVNAYVSPILSVYLENLSKSLPGARLHVMQSNGGMIGIEDAKENGVRCILSGPAGGVVGCEYVARSSQLESAASNSENSDLSGVITFDMGGTSTDVSLYEKIPSITTEAIVGGYPIGIPMYDIHTIGAGGGSIATIDAGGSLRVGPQSAGADPGPACYGKSNLPTVTDANLVLGRLLADNFLGGEMKLDRHRSQNAITQLGAMIGTNPIQTALGIITIINTHMERALRVISVERGHDPIYFTLISFGGAGGLHAISLARQLGIHKVLVPYHASTLSAFGMLVANVTKDYSQTVMKKCNQPAGMFPVSDIRKVYNKLIKRAVKEMTMEGFEKAEIHLIRSLDMRYQGQSYEIPIPYSDDPIGAFHHIHQNLYGYHRHHAPIEIVNLRVRAIGKVDQPKLLAQNYDSPSSLHAFLGEEPVITDIGLETIPVFKFEKLKPGNLVHGPALIIRLDTTIFLENLSQAIVDPFMNLQISI
jgi:N-methylhydantoinase A